MHAPAFHFAITLVSTVLQSGSVLAGGQCPQALAAHQVSDIGLSFEDFDQTKGKGWRQLESEGCYAEAAALIESYLAANPNTHPVLRWHSAQMYAFAGSVSKAITVARTTLRREEVDSSSPFRWNPYVLGTIAFLERNRDQLEHQLAVLAAAAEAFPHNRPNHAALLRLLRCFEQSYLKAYSCTE